MVYEGDEIVDVFILSRGAALAHSTDGALAPDAHDEPARHHGVHDHTAHDRDAAAKAPRDDGFATVYRRLGHGDSFGGESFLALATDRPSKWNLAVTASGHKCEALQLSAQALREVVEPHVLDTLVCVGASIYDHELYYSRVSLLRNTRLRTLER